MPINAPMADIHFSPWLVWLRSMLNQLRSGCRGLLLDVMAVVAWRGGHFAAFSVCYMSPDRLFGRRLMRICLVLMPQVHAAEQGR